MSSYILPGLGADASMYGEAFGNLNAVRYINWPAYNNEHTIAAVSERIIRENNIRQNDTVGGSSLGGIVAADISRHVNLHKLILIGSTLTPDNINPVLKRLSILSEITPVNLIQTLAGKASSLVENRLLNMFSNADALFIKSMCRAVFEWQGHPRPTCAVAHIHGAKDTVISPPSTGAEIIRDGGHLIAMTHEQAVVKFLRTNTTP
jgi:pimeloyl-ACP methyl ester carboxylesterase